jgi:hypothetical protein
MRNALGGLVAFPLAFVRRVRAAARRGLGGLRAVLSQVPHLGLVLAVATVAVGAAVFGGVRGSPPAPGPGDRGAARPPMVLALDEAADATPAGGTATPPIGPASPATAPSPANRADSPPPPAPVAAGPTATGSGGTGAEGPPAPPGGPPVLPVDPSGLVEVGRTPAAPPGSTENASIEVTVHTGVDTPASPQGNVSIGVQNYDTGLADRSVTVTVTPPVH